MALDDYEVQELAEEMTRIVEDLKYMFPMGSNPRFVSMLLDESETPPSIAEVQRECRDWQTTVAEKRLKYMGVLNKLEELIPKSEFKVGFRVEMTMEVSGKIEAYSETHAKNLIDNMGFEAERIFNGEHGTFDVEYSDTTKTEVEEVNRGDD